VESGTAKRRATERIDSPARTATTNSRRSAGESFLRHFRIQEEFWMRYRMPVVVCQPPQENQPRGGAGAELQSGYALLPFRSRTAFFSLNDLKVLALK